MIRRTPRSTLTYTRFPYTTLFLSTGVAASATPPESVTAIQRVRNSDQLLNQRFGARPVSVTRCRVQVTHGADLDDLAAPVLRQPDDSRFTRQRVVVACGNDVRERQAHTRPRQPAAPTPQVLVGIAGGQRRIERAEEHKAEIQSLMRN